MANHCRRVTLILALGLAAPLYAQPVTQLKTMSASGAIGANGEAVIMPGTAGMASLLIQTTGTFSLTWELQCSGSGDGTTFDQDDEIPVTLVSVSPAPSDSITGSVEGLYTATIAGCRAIRVIATAFTSGSMAVTLTAISTGGSGAGGGGGGGGVISGSVSIIQGGNTAAVNASSQLSTDTEMSAAAALANGTANPTVPGVGAYSMVYNGTTWDRMTIPAAACDDPARVSSVNVSLTAGTGNTELVALTASQIVYVCGFSLFAGGDSDVILSYGTGTACGTGNTDLATFGFTSTAGLGIAVANGGAAQMKTATSNALCVERGSSVTLKGFVAYVKQ